MRQANAKDRILQTAGQLFFQRGYSEVGINEIIERAETAKASFYQHFSSKEALCEAWLAAVHDRSEDQRAALLAAASNPTAKLECYFDELAAFMINSQFRGCPYSNTGAVSDATCTGIVAQIQGHKDSLRRFFREICNLQLDESSRAEESVIASSSSILELPPNAKTSAPSGPSKSLAKQPSNSSPDNPFFAPNNRQTIL